MIIDDAPFARMLNGPNADIELRAYYESLRSQLQGEQSTWLPQWSQLSRYCLPRMQRFNYFTPDQGYRMDQDLVDNTPTMALRTLAAGMMSGMSSPTREWFKLKTDDDDLNELPEVQDYLEHYAKAIRDAMLKSNFYPTLHGAYANLGLYGTQAFAIYEHPEDDIRCYPYPIGSYFLGGDAQLRIQLCMRVINMTAEQLVQEYGTDNVSSAVLQYYQSTGGGVKEQWWPIVHTVHPNTYYGAEQAKNYPPWVCVAYELNATNSAKSNNEKELKLLKRGGYQENPIIASRWDVTGENIYGNSPGMDALGDMMSLQLKERRKAEAIDKMVKPPMIASPAMKNQKMSILPGDVTFGDTKDGSMGFKPAFEMKFDITQSNADMELTRNRINEALFKSLFLMISGSDRRQVTAEEIRAKQEEKMLVMGPVLERSNGELYKPCIARIAGILKRRGKISAAPPIMRGRSATFHFESITAQAQRMIKIASLDRLAAFVGQQAAVNPDALDIIDSDEMNREYANDLGVAAKVIRTPEAVAALRQQKQQAAQAAQMAENASKLAPAAEALGNTDMNSDSALTRLLGTVGASTAPAP